MTVAPSTPAVDAPIRFQVGARTIASIPRQLVRVEWSLDDVLAGAPRPLPDLGAADGYALVSVPERLLDTIRADGFATLVRQRYPRHWTDLTIGHDAWLARMSANARSALRRKTKRLHGDGRFAISACRTPAEIAVFRTLARPLSAETYQAQLLGAGLPDDAAFRAMTDVLAGRDGVRAWLLLHDDVAVAYLWCTADGATLRYDHVGHDPAFAHLSPGTVLHAEAMRQSFDDRFARFDFTSGDGQHKRQFATAGEPCVDLLMLRPTLANRALLAALARFDRATAWAKRRIRPGRLRFLRRA